MSRKLGAQPAEGLYVIESFLKESPVALFTVGF